MRLHKYLVYLCLSILLTGYVSVYSADLSVSWTGSGDGKNWSDPENWDPVLGLPPVNYGSVELLASIPAGSSDIIYELAGDSVIKKLTQGTGSILRFNKRGCNLIASEASFPGNGARIYVSNGAVAGIGATTYSATGLNGYQNYTLLSSEGKGSILDLSGMTELNDNVDIGRHATHSHSIVARNGGVIDFSNLRTIIGPRGEDTLNIQVDGVTVLELPALTSVNSVALSVTNGGKIEAKNTSWKYSGTGKNAYRNYTLFSADGGGSVLDLSGMTELNDNVDIGRHATHSHSIVARAGGTVDLSGLQTIVGPAATDMLNINVGHGSNIKLDSLTTTSHGSGAGRILLNVDGGACLTLPSLFAVGSTEFHVTNGAKLKAGNSAWTYSATGLNGYQNYTLLSSEGKGSILDLSGMTELNDNVDIGRHATHSHSIVARNGGVIDFSNLRTIIGPRGEDTLNIQVDGVTVLELPALTSVNSVALSVTNGGKIEAKNTSWKYSGTGKNAYRNYTLFSADGGGSVLDLSGMTELNDNVDIGRHATHSHYIVARNGGVINFSSIERVFCPQGQDSLRIVIEDGGTIILGNVNFNRWTNIALNDPNDLLIAVDDLNLGNTVQISNPGHGRLALAGDFSYWHQNPAVVDLTQSRVYLDGRGPQHIEVGGLDVSEFIEFLPQPLANFGMGQMVIGRCGRSTVVELVDNVDNGLRDGFGGPDEALYLFGKDDEDGLKIKEGSTLYLGGLHAYAMIGGAMTDLRTLFDDGETIVAFDQGYIALGGPDVNSPDNLISNGTFEHGAGAPTEQDPVVSLAEGTTSLEAWGIDQDHINWTHESHFTDAGQGEYFVDIGGSAVSKGALQQTITTVPGNLYRLWMSIAANPFGNLVEDASIKRMQISAAGQSTEVNFDSSHDVGSPPEPGQAWEVHWRDQQWSFVADSNLTTLRFESIDDPNTEFGIAIDNVLVLDGGPAYGPADLNFDQTCSVQDVDIFTDWWLDGTCNWENCFCGGADINQNGKVDFSDFAGFAQHWLRGLEDELSLNITSSEGGSVVEPGQFKFVYSEPTEQAIRAEAEAHYHFAGWAGSAAEAGLVTDVNNPVTTVWVDGRYTLVAEFAEDAKCTLETSSTSGGAVVLPGEGSFEAYCGDSISVSALPDEHFRFVGWTGSAVNAQQVESPDSAQATVTLSNNYTLKAHFAPVSSLVSISSSDGGEVKTPGEGDFSYDYGSRIDVNAMAESGFYFAGWTGTAVDAGKVDNADMSSTTITVDGDYTLKATFQVIECTLTVSSNENGHVTVPGEGAFKYPCGSTVTIKATPSDCFQFTGWSGTAEVTDPCAVETTVVVDGNVAVTASFERNPVEDIYIETLEANPGWTTQGQWSFGIPSGEGGQDHGYSDPTSGATGTNVYGINLSGDYNNAIGGPYFLTAGPFMTTGYCDLELSFASWLNTDYAEYVVCTIQVSTDGTEWTDVWQNPDREEILTDDWATTSYDISGVADDQQTVYVRWGYNVIAERAYAYSGWNIDDIRIAGRQK